LVLAALATPALRAADGDPLGVGLAAFDVGGNQTDSARAVVVQPDGKIVLAGRVETGVGAWRLALARFLPGGTLDPTFGGSGLVVNPFGLPGNHEGAALHLLGDGRILVAGTRDFAAGDQDFLVGRLLANGAPDTSFGGTGLGFTYVTFDLGGDATDGLAAMTVDRSNRILLVGSVDVSPTDIDFGVARLTPDGAPDPSFSGDGRTTVPVTVGAIDLGLSVAVDGNGRILVAGAAWVPDTGGHFAFALARLLADGSLDGTFGVGGVMVTSFASGNGFVWGVGIWPDGEIVAAGDLASGANQWTWMLLIYSSSGSFVDAITGDFCSAGSPPCPPAPQDSPRALLLEGDGKILFAGFGLGPSGSTDFGVGRYTRGLDPDLGFGVNGTTTYDFAYGSGVHADVGAAMALDYDGRIIVAGSAEWIGLDTDFAWVRLDSSYVFADGFDWPGGWARWSAVVP
jgi:uncharacterized delta-60 repeat protein